MAAEVDWPRLAMEAAGSLLSAAGGAAIAIWRWGRNSAKQEQAVKEDYTTMIATLERDMWHALREHQEASDDRLNLLVEQFKESFTGLRRQIDDDRLHTEQKFLRKDDFRDFREEYREDMRDLKASIVELREKK